MKIWDELSSAGKVAASITAIIVLSSTISSVGYAAYSHFQTDKEAEAARLVIVNLHASDRVTDRQARMNDRIDRLERENTRYEKDNLNPALPDVEREFNNRQIKKNDAKIACIRKQEC